MEQFGVLGSRCEDSASQPERTEDISACKVPSGPRSLVPHFEVLSEKKPATLMTFIAASVEQLPHDSFNVTVPWIHDVQPRIISLDEELRLFASFVQVICSIFVLRLRSYKTNKKSCTFTS